MAIDIDQAISAAALAEVDDATSLQRAGLDSLAILRLAAQVVDEDGEVDPAGLADVRTIGDLKRWLRVLADGPRLEGAEPEGAKL
jgi:aryl carrier-like protein